MKGKYFAKRTIAALLTLVLAFSSVNFNVLSVYADDVAIEKTEVVSEYADEITEAEITEDSASKDEIAEADVTENATSKAEKTEELISEAETAENVIAEEEITEEEVATEEALADEADQNGEENEYGLVINDYYNWENNSFENNHWVKEVDIQAIAEDKYFILANITDDNGTEVLDDVSPSNISFEVETEEGKYDAVTDAHKISVDKRKEGGFFVLSIGTIGRYRMSVNKDGVSGYVYINAKVPFAGFYTSSTESSTPEAVYDTYIKDVAYIGIDGKSTLYFNVDDSQYDEDKYEPVYEAAFSEGDIEEDDFGKLESKSFGEERTCDVRDTSNPYCYKFEIYGKTNYTIAVRVRLKDRSTGDYSDFRYDTYLRVEYSQKGLVATCEYNEGEKTFTESRNDDCGTYATFNNRIEFTEEVKTPIFFAWNENYNYEFNVGEVSLKSRDEFNKETANYDLDVISIPDDDSSASLNWDSDKGYWVFEASGAGKYKIILNDATKTENNYIWIIINESPLKLSFYKDEDRTKVIEPERYDSIRLYKYADKDVTYYISIDEGSGHYHTWSYDGKIFETDYVEGKDGLKQSGDIDIKCDYAGVFEIQICAGSEINDVFMALDFSLEGAHGGYFIYHISLEEAENGLLAKDWIESSWNDELNAPDLSSLSFGSDARYSKGFGANVSDNHKFVVFGDCTDYVFDESKEYEPVTSGLTVKKSLNNEWVETDEVTLSYLGDEEGVPDNMKGLWEIEAKCNGEYRIYNTDGSFVTVNTAIAPIALYSEQNYSIEKYIDSNVTQYVEGEFTAYIIAKDELGNLPAVVDSVVVHKDGKSATYELHSKSWTNPNGIDVSDISISDTEDCYRYVITIQNGGFDIELKGHINNIDDTQEEINAWYHFEKSLKGLVINSDIKFDNEGNATGEVWNVENYGKEQWFDYRNYPHFVLAQNKEVSEVKSANQLSTISGTKNLKVEIFDTKEEKYVESEAILSCAENNVFCLETFKPGDYRITYVEDESAYDGLYVDIHITSPYIGFFAEDAFDSEKDEFNINSDNVYHFDSYQITSEDIAAGKKSFYALRVCPDEEDGVTYNYDFDIKAKTFVDGNENATILVDNSGIVNSNTHISVTAANIDGAFVFLDDEDITDRCKIYKITVSDDGEKYIPFRNYFFEINNKVEAKIGEQVIYGYDDCAGLSLIGVDISNLDIKWNLNHTRYDGTPVEIVFEDEELAKVLFVEYVCEEDLNDENADRAPKTNPGTVYYRIFGCGNYTGILEGSFVIKPALNKDSIVGTRNFVATYTGSQIKVDPIVREKGQTMKEGVDYYILYKDRSLNEVTPINVGSYIYEIRGIGDSGTDSYISGSLEIKAIDLSAAKDVKVELVKDSAKVAFPAKMTYDEVDNYVENGIDLAVSVGGKTLEAGTDYTAEFEGSAKVGTMNFVVTYKGNYSGKTTKVVTVSSGMVFSALTVSVEVVDTEGVGFTYTGDEIKPTVKVVKKNGDVELVKDVDYTVVYGSNINAGTATITVTGIADKGYSGSVKTTFVIKKAAMTAENVSVQDVVYDPAGNIPSINVTCGKEGTDYVLKYENNKTAGTAKVTVTFKGSLTGAPVVKEFAVKPVDIKTVNNNSVLEYFTENEGEYVTPVSELAYNTVALKEGTDYTVTYTAISDGAEVKDGKLKAGSKSNPYKYSVRIDGIGNYNETLNQTDRISVSSISRTDISDFVIVGLDDSYVYNTDIEAQILDAIFDEGDVYIEKNGTIVSDLNVSVLNASKVGKAKVYLMAENDADYYGTAVAEINIVPKNLPEYIGRDFYMDTVENLPPYIDKKGKLVTGELRLYDNGKQLVKGKDYTISYDCDELKHQAKVTLTINFKGNYTGVFTPESNVEGCKITSLVSVTGYKDAVYTGKEINYKLNVKVNAVTATGEKFVATLKSEDYDVNYYRYGYKVSSVKDAGRYCINIAPKGKYYSYNYDGYVWYFESGDAMGFNITPALISKAKLTLETTKYEFNETIAASGATPSVTVKYNNIVVDSSEYTVEYTGNKKPGTGHITITGNGQNFDSYSELTGKFDITGAIDISTSSNISVTVADKAAYNPNGAIPSVTVKYGNEVLVQGEDYKITAKNNNAVGNAASLTITGIGKYKGTTAAYNYSIEPADLSTAEYQAQISYGKVKSSNYFGMNFKYMVTTYNGKSQTIDPVVKVGNKTLKLGTDYELTYTDRDEEDKVTSIPTASWEGGFVREAGEYQIHITGKGNYKNTFDTDVNVIVTSPSAKSIKFKAATVNYDGEPVTNAISDVKLGSVNLVEGVDYFVSYDKEYTNRNDFMCKLFGVEVLYAYEEEDVENNNVLPGKKTAYIVGIGNYSYMGAKEVNYTIKGVDIGKAKFSKLPDYIYEGFAIDVANDLIITTTLEGKNITLECGKDYTLSYPTETINAGTKTVLVQGKGMFEGTSKKVTFKVNPQKFEGKICGNISEVPTLRYSPDTNAMPYYMIKDNSGFLMNVTVGTDYTVKLSNNKAAAMYDSKNPPTMTFTFKGNYTGSVKVAYTIEKENILAAACMSVADVAAAVDSKTGFVKAYKSIPVVKTDDEKFTLKAGTDYTIKYTYYTDTLVYDGKTKQWLTRKSGSEVQAKDQFKPGVAICVYVEGKNNYIENMSKVYYVVNK